MKKRIMPVLLALCLVLELTPVGAWAAEQLPVPTELKWGISYGDSGSLQDAETIPGAVSWKAGGDHATEFLLEFYQGGEVGADIPSLIIAAEQMEAYSDLYFLSSDPETGNYYFTVTAKGDGINYSDSGSARSETWAYKRPNAQLDQVSVGSWITLDEKPAASWIALSSENVFAYEIELFFSALEDGSYSCISTVSSKNADPEWSGVDFPSQDISKPGFYKYRVRAISRDITQYQNGSWSEMSEPYHLKSSTPPEPSKTELTTDMFAVDTTPETYDGTEKTKVITSSLVEGTEYTVSYANNKNVGTATITITGKGNYLGTLTYVFEIVEKDILFFSIVRNSVTLIDGNSATPKITLYPQEATINWSSSSSAVVTVDSNGTITGVGEGSAVITGTAYHDGQEKTATYTVTVKPRVGITLVSSEIIAPMPNPQYKLYFSYSPLDANITVNTSNASVADVSYSAQAGAYIIPKNSGTAVVTVTVEKDGSSKSASCMVTVPSTENELIQKYIGAAQTYVGKGYSEVKNTLGLSAGSGSWCADFASQVAKSVGLGDAIPANNGCSALRNSVLSKKGYDVTGIPKVGDLVFFKWNKTCPDCPSGNKKYESSNRFDHVGIVTDVNGDSITVVHGNYGRAPNGEKKVTENKWNIKHHTCIKMYTRPNWTAGLQQKNGKVIIQFRCPIDVRYVYGDEVLDSATGQLEASFGTMVVNDEEESITVTLYDYYDVDVEITGNGEGTMDLTTTFEDEDGTTSTRSFQNVPIFSDTVGKLYSADSVATAYLELYENQGADFIEVWAVDKNETAIEKNVELTDWYTSDNDFGNDEPAPTPTPPTGGGGSSSWNDDDDDRPSTPPKTPVPTETPAPTTSPEPTVVAVADRFTDVKPTDWFADAVQYVCDEGMMNGTTKNTFSPHAPIGRGMLVTILYRLEEEPSVSAAAFSDVASGKYYAKAVAWASRSGLVNGFGDGSFRPDEPVTREQIAAILYRYTAYKSGDVIARADLGGFTDAAQISGYAREPLAWAKAKGLINGTDWGGIHPGGYATRAETAAILMRFCENAIK